MTVLYENKNSRELFFRCYHNDEHMVYFTLGQPVPDGVIMQYIGVTDKNNKKIYEGDILDNGWVISFNDCMFGVFTQNTYMGFSKYMAEFREVVGNIYENTNNKNL